MVLGRSAERFMAQQQDNFLSRLEQAEARDAAVPTGAQPDPRYFHQQRQPAGYAPPRQHILPTSNYEHHPIYRTGGLPAAPREVTNKYGPFEQRSLVSRQQRRHMHPLESQVPLAHPSGPEPSLKSRVNYPVNLPRGEEPRAHLGGKTEDRPAGGRANLAGPSNTHGTALHHHHLRG